MRQFVSRNMGLLLACLTVALFVLWPKLDLSLAARFYEPGRGFSAGQKWWIQLPYVAVAKAGILAPVLLFLLLLGYLPRTRHWTPKRMVIAYLLAVLVVGPGLIANTVFKDHWGRPRPVHLTQFGGQSTFTPALQPSNQCRRNCSFVSGHAAAGFYPMAGFWVTRRRGWLAGGMVFGLFVGFTRMAVGAHFLSDVLFAGLVVYFACWICSFLLQHSHGAAPLRAKPGDSMSASEP
jgi:lipid A 4'-phosphatase